MIEELKIIIKAETSKFKKDVDAAEKEIKTFKDQIADAGKEIDKSFKNAGEKISSGIKAGITTATVAVGAASAALIGAAAATEEYRANQAKLTTAFEAAGGAADVAKETYNDLYRVLGDDGQATEAAAHLAQLTTNQKELEQWTTICQGVYATFGDSLPIEGLTEAANETAKVGAVTGGLADALNWAGVSEDAFNEKLAACNTEAEREALIRDTLNGIYADAAATYEKNAEDTLKNNEAQQKLTDNLAALGEAVSPIITEFKNFAGEALAKVVPYVKDLGEKYAPVLKDALEKAGKAVNAAFGFFTKHWKVIASIGGVIAGIAAAIGLYNTVAAIKAAMDTAQVATVWGLVSAHIAQAAAAMAALAPYLLIVAAIAAVIAIIVLCVKYWDEIVNAVKVAIAAIVEVLSTIGEWIYNNVIKPIADFFAGLWKSIVGGYHTVIDPWIEIFKRIAPIIYENVIKPIADFFVKLWDGIKNVFSQVGSWFNNTVIQPLVRLFTGIWDSIKNGASKAWQGIKNVFAPVANFFGDIFSTAWGKVKAVFSVGGKIFDGIKDGIVSTFKTVVNAIITGINKVVKLPFEGLNGILNTIAGLTIAGIKPFEWLTWRAPVPQIPMLAAGGIVTNDTVARIGEEGYKEAVLPLERNTEWMDILADRIAARNGAPSKIVLTVDGRVLAETTANRFNEYTLQTGKFPLVIV